MSYQWITRENYRELIQSPGWSVNAFGDGSWLSLYDDQIRIAAYSGAHGIEQCVVCFEGGMKGLKTIITPPLAPYVGEAWMGNPKALDFTALHAFFKSEGFGKVKLEFSPDTSALLSDRTDMIPRVTYRLNLPDEAGALPGLYSSKTRNMVSKARREGALWSVNHDSAGTWQRLQAHYERKKIKSGKEQLARVVNEFVKTGRAFTIDVVEHNQITWSGVFYLHEDTCYYLAGALNPNHSSNASGTFGLYGSMCECIARGMAVFDFEGSSVPAIARFFKGFGGVATRFAAYSNESWLWRIIGKIRK
jgi:hypothetical protein